MKSVKTTGIVLHTVKYSETSLIVYMLTRHAGRQTYMVQGVRSPKSRTNKAALFQPMFLLEFESLHNPAWKMSRFKDVRAIEPLQSMIFDISKSTISLFMAETIYRLIKESEQNEDLFDFIYHSVVALNSLKHGVANFHLWFLVKLSYFLGFYPENEYEKGDFFDVKEGCFIRHEPDHRMALGQDKAFILSELINIELESLDELKLSGEQRSEFLVSLLNYFAHHFDAVHNIRSVEILREVF
ncbi:MAG: DNA repair protein RecO [Rikenellaceae bacterium]